MTEYTNEKLNVRFTLPDNPTVKQQLNYRGRVFSAGTFSDDVYLRYWFGFLSIYKEWTGTKKSGKEYEPCELVPDPNELDMEKETNSKIADIVHWVGNTTALHMMELDNIPKN